MNIAFYNLQIVLLYPLLYIFLQLINVLHHLTHFISGADPRAVDRARQLYVSELVAEGVDEAVLHEADDVICVAHRRLLA